MLLGIEISKESTSTIVVCLVCLVIYLTIILATRQICLNKSKKIFTIINSLAIYILLFVGGIIILKIWGIDLYPFLAASGIVLFIVGLSFQDLFKDLVSGIKIISNETIKEDDIVEINGFTGRVEKVTLVSTILVDTLGKRKNISNREIKEITNYSDNLLTGFIDITFNVNEDIEYIISILDRELSSFNENYRGIVEGPNIYGLTDICEKQVLRITFKSKYEDISLIERSLRKEVVSICIKNNIKMFS